MNSITKDIFAMQNMLLYFSTGVMRLTLQINTVFNRDPKYFSKYIPKTSLNQLKPSSSSNTQNKGVQVYLTGLTWSDLGFKVIVKMFLYQHSWSCCQKACLHYEMYTHCVFHMFPKPHWLVCTTLMKSWVLFGVLVEKCFGDIFAEKIWAWLLTNDRSQCHVPNFFISLCFWNITSLHTSF